MSLASATAAIGERLPWPDPLTRAAISLLVGRTDRRLSREPESSTSAFAAGMDAFPVATHVEDANVQHYEVPAEFFRIVLGERLKYSCCHYDDATTSLDMAERRALQITCENAGLADGQTVLELGCGWGSLSLWMAEHFPNSRIVSVSNSQSQRRHIMSECARLGLNNLTVVTSDMNDFDTAERFDRVVSVEMFEHMSNWRELLARIRGWLEPDGRLFVHVFSHATAPYRFDHTDPADWIARYFFTGGIMPSHDLMSCFPESFAVERDWRWSGEHYRRTADDWLANFDARREEVESVLSGVYGRETRLWMRRWRLFFLATSGLFGHASGKSWGVSHYLMAPARGD